MFSIGKAFPTLLLFIIGPNSLQMQLLSLYVLLDGSIKMYNFFSFNLVILITKDEEGRLQLMLNDSIIALSLNYYIYRRLSFPS